jgi:hypothetical protein
MDENPSDHPPQEPAAPRTSEPTAGLLGGAGTRRAPRRQRGRRLVRELLTITAAVLIALLLEGLREWAQERLLVREAVASINREIVDNLRDVEAVILSADQRTQNLDNALQLANALIEGLPTAITQIELGFDLAELSAASWQTAERTGALAHMSYEQARSYFRVYEAQALFVAHQQRAMTRLEEASASLSLDPYGALPADIERFRGHLLALKAQMDIEQQLARRLSEGYRDVLEGRPAGGAGAS